MMAGVTRVAIVGGGPGGYEAALVAAQLDAEVTVVERDGVGGAAVLTDCVPSKTLVATAALMTAVEGVATSSAYGLPPRSAPTSTWSTRRVKQLAAAQSSDVARRLAAEGVRVVAGARPARRHPDRAGRRRVRREPGGARRRRRRAGRDRRATADGRTAPAGRRADPHLAAGLRPRPSCRSGWWWSGRASPGSSSPAPTWRSAARWCSSPAATGCCPARTPTPPG